MPRRAAIDSGPLIALFDASDRYHQKAVEFIKGYRGQLYSTTAVITEVMYLLGFSVRAQINFLQWVVDGAIETVEVDKSDLCRIIEMTKKYSDLPMDFADGSLVAVCEKLKIKNVVSLDSDFYIYRTKNKSALKNLFLS
jgi:predicted nucleic acid-binding protein